MKICCGIVLFNPSEIEINQIEEKRSAFEKIYVFDNTPNPQKIDIHCNEIEIFSENINKGLSYAYDFLCKTAKERGYEYIMLLDQDSIMTTENIFKMIQFIGTFQQKNKVGIYTPFVEYNVKNIKSMNKVEEYDEVNWCISSGSIINLDVFDKEVRFDINYFIDRVDRDYCKQLILKKYKIIRINKAVLIQKLGEMRRIFGINYSSHSALRHYYISRNRLYYNKKYNELFIKSVLQTIRHFFFIVLLENHKFLKINAFFHGIKDYKNMKYGKKGENITI